MSGKLSLFVKLWLSQYDDWKSFAERENFSKKPGRVSHEVPRKTPRSSRDIGIVI